MIGSLYQVVIDCPEPRKLAKFYSEVLGLPVTHDDPEWVSLGGGGNQVKVAFQQAPSLRRAQWPSDEHPQQLHLDIEVTDVSHAETAVLALGARRLPGEGDDFRVFEDPSGHPFCLVFDVG